MRNTGKSQVKAAFHSRTIITSTILGIIFFTFIISDTQATEISIFESVKNLLRLQEATIGTVNITAFTLFDTTPPDTTVTEKPREQTNSGNALFRFTGTDDVGITGFECSLDGASFTTCTTPQFMTGFSDGLHTFAVRAKDAANNVDPTPATYSWTIDRASPAVPVVLAPTNGSTTNDSRPPITGTAEPNSTVEIFIDGVFVPTATTPANASGNFSLTLPEPLSASSHTVRARAVDAAANASTLSSTRTFTVSPAAPSVFSIYRGSRNPAAPDTTVYYTIIFSENVMGVNAADFILNTTGISGASISSVNGGNWNYTVAVNTGSGIGTLRLDVVDDDSITDANGNPLGGTGAGNGNFTIGQTYTINDPGLTLGNYTNTTVNLSGNATITPDAAPAGVTYTTATTTADFKGELEVDPTTGVVRVTNAHPANRAGETYTVTVTAYSANGATTKTFNLTVGTPSGCNAFHPLSFAGVGNDAVSLGTNSVAVGDFNGDGKQDVAATNGNGNVNSVSVLIRNAANNGFDAKVDYNVGLTPQSVAVGDLNGDGRQDIVTANSSSNNVSVLLRNAANNGFDAVASYAVGYGPVSVAVGDFNNDGKQDIVAANDFDNSAALYSNNVSVLMRNETNDGFDAAINLTVGLGPSSVAVGDFNGDGKHDIIAANSGPGHDTISVILRNAANNGFETKVDYSVSNNLFTVAVGDFNGDGKQDIVAVKSTGSIGSAYVLIRNAANTGFESPVEYPLTSGLYSLAVGDFNNDGKQDLAISNTVNNTVSVLLRNAANNAFDAKIDFPGGSFTRGLAIGDFNGDNRQDIAVANASNNNVWVLQRVCNNPPTFTSVTNQTRAQANTANSQIAVVSDPESAAGSLTVTAPTVPSGITVSNIVNNNGTITADVGAGNSTAPSDYTVVLTVSDGELSTNANLIVTVAPTTPEIVVRGNNVVIADEDSTPSLADHTDFGTVSTITPFERTFTIENIGAPQLTVQNVTVSGGQASAFTVTQQPASSIQLLGTTTFKIQFAPSAAGLHSTTVSFANDDSDENPFNFVIQGTGLEPPALGNYANTSIALSGNTTIAPDAAPTNTTNLTATTTADFKGELEVDSTTGIIRITNAHPAGVYTVTLRATNVIGTATKTLTLTVTTPLGCNSFTPSSFLPAVNYNLSQNPHSVAIGDFNGDGKQDVVTANGFSPNVSVLLRNSANNGFDAPSNFNVDSLPFSVAVGDFNSDGKPDIVTANKSGDNVSVLLRNAANNGFNAAVHFAVGDNPMGVDVADFNGDGKQDIVAANENPFSTGSVSVLIRNAANDGFEPKVDFPVGNSSESVAVGDFNGDGKPDIVITGPANNVSVLIRNAANNGFEPKVDYPTSGGHQAVEAGDFNGDGKQDIIAVGNQGSLLLRNTANDGFDTAVTFPTTLGAVSIAIGDFNNDGKQDFVTAGNGAVSVHLRNAANNGFDPKVDFAAGTNIRAVAIGDFNGDNLQDIVAANGNGGNVSVFQRLCNNPPTFTSITNQNRPQGTSSNAQIATVSDDITAAGSINVQATVPPGISVSNIVNNNGTITADVGAANNAAPGDYTVVLTAFDGELSTNANLTVTVPPTTPEIIVRGNNAIIVDEDNTPSANDYTDFGTVSVGIAQERTFTIENIGVPQLTLGNITVSGDQAAAFTVTQQPASPVALNNSTTFKVQFAPTALGLQSTTISFGNNDPDENPFNFVIQGTGVAAATLGNYANTTIALSSNTTVTPSAAPVDTVYATATTTADFKGELEIDPATGIVRATNAHPAGIYTVALRAANAGGTTMKTFTLTVNTPPSCATFNTSSFTTASSLGVGTGPSSVAVGDVNGDGKQDLVTANSVSGVNTVSVLVRNAANNGFDPKVDYTVGTQPRSAAIADFNGDGKQDLAVTNSNNKVSILYRNAANNGFETPLNFTVGNNLSSMAIGDFNNDGKPDIAVTDSSLNTVFMLMRNAANDGFDTPVNFIVPNSPLSIAVGDFNGDGKQDIVTGNSNFSNNVSVLLRNAANEGFEPAVNLTVGNSSGLVTVGDVNGDGKQDIVTNNSGNVDNVSLLLRNAINTGFDSAINLSLSGNISRLAIGDFNNDGKQDLAVIKSTNTLSVLLRNAANNGFEANIDFTIGNLPQSMAIGDFNSDRKQDIAIGHNGGNLLILQRSGNCPPVIAPSTSLTRQQSTAAINSQIAAVDDVETPAGNLTVQATTVPSGITVSNILNTNGTITADIAADCSAATGDNTVALTVTDGGTVSTSVNLTINVTANTAPTLTYPNASVLLNGSTTINPSTAGDNGIVTYSLQSQGTYTGGISINNTTGAVSISSAAPVGNHTITIRATDNCNATTDAGFTLTVNQAPAITSANNTTFNQGQPGSFQVNATGFPAPTFSILSGALPTGITLSNAGLLAGTTNQTGAFPFTVRATNSVGTNDQSFTLTANARPTVSSISDKSVSAGNTIKVPVSVNDAETPNNLTVTATSGDTTVLSNTNIQVTGSGTSWTLFLTPATAGVSLITVNVSDSSGATNSTTFTLTSNAAVCVTPPTNLISWWAAENSANDIWSSNHGTTAGDLGYIAGKVGQAFTMDGNGDYVNIANESPFDLSSAITVEAWVKVNAFTSPYAPIAVKGDTAWRLQRNANAQTAAFGTTGLSNVDQGGVTNLNDGRWHHVAAVFNGSTKFLYVDGVLDSQAGVSGTIAINNHPIRIGHNSEVGTRFWNGNIDEVGIYNRALSAAEIASIYNASIAGKCSPLNDTTPPDTTITSNPPNPSNNITTAFQFSGIDEVGVNAFECSLDNAAFASCTSPDTVSNLSFSLHTFAVRAKDVAGNLDPTPATYTWMVVEPPTVLSVNRANADPATPGSSVGYIVTFSKNVTGVDTNDFALNTIGTSGASITNVSGSNSTYTVTVNTGSGAGTLRLDVVDNDSIKDGDGNELGGIGTDNGNFQGQVYTIDAPGTLQFSAANYAVGENGTSAVVTVRRVNGTLGSVSATVSTSNGTATAGFDYTATTQTVTFGDGDATDKTINIPITNDTGAEGYETVNLALSNPTGWAVIGTPSSAMLTITDNDTPLTLIVTNLNNSGSGSLRQAIIDAPDGGNITFVVAGTINLTLAEIAINKSLNIVGPGANVVTVSRSGANLFRLFNVTNNSTVTISGLTFTNGFGDFVNAGGIHNSTGSTLTLNNMVFSANHTNNFGGGVFNSLNAILNVSNSTFVDNNASPAGGASGGAITNYGTATINNSTFTGNSARHNGGAIWTTSGTLNIKGSTFSGNSAGFCDGFGCAGTGGGITVDSGTANIDNTIISGNTVNNNPNDLSGTAASGDYNLINSGAYSFTSGGTHNISGNPMLGALADNGGTTPTMALQTGSAAIDKGNSSGLTTDQRDSYRPADEPSNANAAGGDGADIGAFEIYVPRPGALEYNTANYSVSESQMIVTVTINRTNGSDGVIGVNYSLANGTTNPATGGASCGSNADYVNAGTQILSFAHGETSKTFDITICSDNAQEDNETVNLSLSNPTGGANLGSQSTAVLTINNDDANPTFAVNDVSQSEGNSGTNNFTFTITRTGQTALGSSVNFTTQNGTATGGATCIGDVDYVSQTSSVTFDPSDTNRTVTVSICGDANTELDETFTIKLTGANNGTFTDETGAGTILNDDCMPMPSAMVSWYPAESNANDIIGTNNGTMQNGAGFGAGKVGQAFNFDGINDFAAVPNNVSLNITGDITIDAWINPQTYSNFPHILSKRNVDNNHVTYELLLSGSGQFRYSSTNTGFFSEVNSNAIIPLNTWTHVAVTIQGTTLRLYINGSLDKAVAYTPTRLPTDGRLTIGAAETTGCGFGGICEFFKGHVDEVEIFNRALSATEIANLATASGAGKCHTSTLQFDSATYSVNEANTNKTITVTRTGAHDTSATVHYATSADTATNNSDYDDVSGDLTFNAGEVSKTFTIPIKQDASVESSETINLTLSNVTGAGASLGTPSSAILTIVDNDSPPTIQKAFTPTSIPLGGQSTVTITLTNSNPADALTNASFTDTLQNMMAVGGSVGGTCTGTTPSNLTAGATNLSFIGITIPAASSCTVTFTVTSNVAGAHPNTTSGVTTAQTPTAGAPSNTANLTVIAPPQIAKSFSPDTIVVNGVSILQITITNHSANAVALTGVGVTDNFPTGIEVDAAPQATNSCPTGSSFSPTAGATSISISDVTVSTNSACTFTVKVKGTTTGAKLNTTSAVTSTNGGTGATASATLTINNPSISGTIIYGTTPVGDTTKFVPGVLVSASGASDASDTTNSMGDYLISNLIVGGQYTVEPTKNGGANGITAFDATLVLRCVAAGNACALSPNQRIAADVNNDNGISAFDATQILRYVAANGQNANTGQTGSWKFNPISRPYSNLDSNVSGENYTAFLSGEINGDWMPAGSLAETAEQQNQVTAAILVKAEDSSILITAPEVIGTDEKQLKLTDEVNIAEEAITKSEEQTLREAEIPLSLPQNVSVADNNIVIVPVLLTNTTNEQISSYSFAVRFDPNVLLPEPITVETANSLSSNGFMIVSDINQKGKSELRLLH